MCFQRGVEAASEQPVGRIGLVSRSNPERKRVICRRFLRPYELRMSDFEQAKRAAHELCPPRPRKQRVDAICNRPKVNGTREVVCDSSAQNFALLFGETCAVWPKTTPDRTFCSRFHQIQKTLEGLLRICAHAFLTHKQRTQRPIPPTEPTQ